MSNACELIVANSEGLTPPGTRDYGLENITTRQTTYA